MSIPLIDRVPQENFTLNGWYFGHYASIDNATNKPKENEFYKIDNTTFILTIITKEDFDKAKKLLLII